MDMPLRVMVILKVGPSGATFRIHCTESSKSASLLLTPRGSSRIPHRAELLGSHVPRGILARECGSHSMHHNTYLQSCPLWQTLAHSVQQHREPSKPHVRHSKIS